MGMGMGMAVLEAAASTLALQLQLPLGLRLHRQALLAVQLECDEPIAPLPRTDRSSKMTRSSHYGARTPKLPPPLPWRQQGNSAMAH